MKKILLGTLLLATVFLLNAENGTLALDDNNKPVQVGGKLNLRAAITLADGEGVSIVPTDKAVEIWINPNSGTLKYEDNADSTKYFIFDTLLPIPCDAINDSLYIANDSGESVTFTVADNELK